MSADRCPPRRLRDCRSFFGPAALGIAVIAAIGAAKPRPQPPSAAPPSISVTGFSVAEGNAGITAATFVIGLSARTTRPVTVEYTTRDGSAFAATGDYRRASGVLTLDAGATSATVDVAIVGDTVEEPDETLLLVLKHPVGATLAVATASGEIVDDDGAAGPGEGPAFSIRGARVAEGDSGQRTAAFVVTLSAPVPQQEVSVSFTTRDGAATAGEDYRETTGELRFPRGVTTRTISVPVLGDTEDEGDEDFTVELSDPLGAGLAGASAQALVLDDDGTGAVSLELVGSPSRRAIAGQMVALQVRVRNASGELVGGAEVRWEIDGDGQLLDGASTASDPSGMATQRVRLGTGPGRVAIRAFDVESRETALFQVLIGSS